jgi:hypothetical protein
MITAIISGYLAEYGINHGGLILYGTLVNSKN